MAALISHNTIERIPCGGRHDGYETVPNVMNGAAAGVAMRRCQSGVGGGSGESKFGMLLTYRFESRDIFPLVFVIHVCTFS